MLASIASLPQQCEDGWRLAHELRLPPPYRDVDRVVILGIGGSAIGGELVRSLLTDECPVPIVLHRDYGLPGFVDGRTLALACSYSGNTEETLLSCGQAQQRGARVVALTTGGALALRAREHRLPLYLYHSKTQPRAALGYVFTALVGILQRLGMVGDKSADVAEAVTVMRQWQGEIRESVGRDENAAKQLAQRLWQRVPVIYGAEHLGEVARRWKGQCNENSKSWAVFDVLPELNHNTVSGYPLPQGLPDCMHVVMLTADLYHPRVRLRFDITGELLRQHGFAFDTVDARGKSRMAQLLSMVHSGDYVSYYLAMLYEVDPWAIGSIEYVKKRLGAQAD
jgi:glucose/mannose-6-phosphate isomerase